MKPLPKEVWKEIFSSLENKDLLECVAVCKSWNTLIKENHKLFPRVRSPTLIRRIFVGDFSIPVDHDFQDRRIDLSSVLEKLICRSISCPIPFEMWLLGLENELVRKGADMKNVFIKVR